jgi:hypothetical protein
LLGKFQAFLTTIGFTDYLYLPTVFQETPDSTTYQRVVIG